MTTYVTDYVVIGTGLAGSAAALLLAKDHTVMIVGKGKPQDSNSWAAQGGIAAAVGSGDSPALHAKDTLFAGAGLCEEAAVQQLTEEGPHVIDFLLELGVPFERKEDQSLSLGLEGAHAKPRVLHAGGDATGAFVMKTLSQAIAQSQAISTLYDVDIRGLLWHETKGVVGAKGVHTSEDHPKRDVTIFAKKAVILATGGAGQLYARTSNPEGATGDGLLLAQSVGARLRHLEFVQFHPTTLYVEGFRPFLISEAVRGAGGKLVNQRGEAIMRDYALRDLEPRDVVARAIDRHMRQGDQVFLDVSGITDFHQRFPTIAATCRSVNLDVPHVPIPVAPAAHFMMGGIEATLNGTTSVARLYALGEVASTGVHGANRLASNSLLECLVMAKLLAQQVQQQPWQDLDEMDFARAKVPCLFEANRADLQKEVQTILWESAGISRDAGGLRQGLQRMQRYAKAYPLQRPVLAALFILEAASKRQQSIGAHYRTDDHPDMFDAK